MKKIVGIVLGVLVLGGIAVGIGEIIDEKYDYENGKIISEVESERDYDGAARRNQLVATVETAEVKKATATETKTTADDIGKEKAKEIALQHAGVSADQVVWEEVERDYDDGRLEYQVEFRVGNKEYDYEIDGKTGNVLEKDFDVDDDGRYDDDRWDD